MITSKFEFRTSVYYPSISLGEGHILIFSESDGSAVAIVTVTAVFCSQLANNQSSGKSSSQSDEGCTNAAATSLPSVLRTLNVPMALACVQDEIIRRNKR
jgi:hypothetical protein